MKTCRICNEAKPPAAFSPKRDNRDGLQSSCRSCVSANTKAWYAANKPKALAAQAAWRKANRERWNSRMSAATAKRRAARLQAVPSWADHGLMADIYAYAAAMRAFGVPAEVDHIVPLQAELACGFHSHDNITVILSSENRSKRNALPSH